MTKARRAGWDRLAGGKIWFEVGPGRRRDSEKGSFLSKGSKFPPLGVTISKAQGRGHTGGLRRDNNATTT